MKCNSNCRAERRNFRERSPNSNIQAFFDLSESRDALRAPILHALSANKSRSQKAASPTPLAA
jgi:hypothetical protein